MKFEEILDLIQAVSDSSLTEFKMNDGEIKISMKTDKAAAGVHMMVEAAPAVGQIAGGSAPVVAPAGTYQTLETRAEADPADGDVKITGNVVKAPLVGTFYAAGSPDAEPFVKVGDAVKKGQTLGIVEAMKLMNEIESDYDGTVAEILVENESVVEYGQPMFVIR